MELESKLTDIIRLNDFQKKALNKLGIESIRDLLYHFPERYGDVSEMQTIGSLEKGSVAVIFGKISGLKTSKAFYKKIPMAEGKITDETGTIKAVWFNQPYLAKMIPEGSLVRVDGKVSDRKGELYFSNPKIETVQKAPIGVGDSLFGQDGESHSLYPVYAESRGITSNWIFHTIQKIFKSGLHQKIEDPLPAEILKKYNLPSLATALVWIHVPQKRDDALSARKRFSFEEVFFIQLERQKSKLEYQKNNAWNIGVTPTDLEKFTSRFPFTPTNAQKNAIGTILKDFGSDRPMMRLLEGDVGSGKTFVAAATAYAAINTKVKNNPSARLQVAYMAPTEILASQHFESFKEFFSYLGIQIGYLSGSGCQKFPSKTSPKEATPISKTQLKKWVANGEIPIVIGTHALIQKSVEFKNLAYVIIDEQHRFGTAQRQKLVSKDTKAPHLLSMTATPIPRTLSLTIFGDLDLTLLDEMPAGRKQVITEIVLPDKRKEIYEEIRSQLRIGHQAYIICPRIDEPDPTKELAVNAKSATEEAKRLKKEVFPEYEIAVLHSKMKPSDKDKAMESFKSGKINILVATSVVEVGVNIPNATVIIIEGAERFGLAQLHQLRGRVLRSSDQAYCYIFTETRSGKTTQRLQALKSAKNGFELAEYDLKFRGSGALSGKKQWGISDVAMEALKNIKMVEAARTEAQILLKTDPEFQKHPLIKSHLQNHDQMHFE